MSSGPEHCKIADEVTTTYREEHGEYRWNTFKSRENANGSFLLSGVVPPPPRVPQQTNSSELVACQAFGPRMHDKQS